MNNISKINAQLVLVTPQMAAKWLESNKGNRPISERKLRDLVRDMQTPGAWVTNHEAIAIGESGNLLNGQHRLTAIVRSGVSVLMMVVTGLPFDSALGYLCDRGMTRRESLVANRDKETCEEAKVIGRLAGRWSLGISELQAIADCIAEDSLTFRRAKTTTFSVAGVRAGCILRRFLCGGDLGYIEQQYEALVSRKANVWSLATTRLNKWLEEHSKESGSEAATIKARVVFHLIAGNMQEKTKIQLDPLPTGAIAIAKTLCDSALGVKKHG